MPTGVIHVESWDYYSTAELSDRYDFVSMNPGAGGGVVAGKGRRGSQGFWCNSPQGGDVTKNFAGDINEQVVYLGAAYNFPNGTSFDVSAGPTLLHLRAMNHFGETGSFLSSRIFPDGRIALDLYSGADLVNLWMSEPGVLRYGSGMHFVEMAGGLTLVPHPELRPAFRYHIYYFALRVDEELLVEFSEPIGIFTDAIRGWSGFKFRAPGFVAMDDNYVGAGEAVDGGGGFLGDVEALPLYVNGAGDVAEWTPDPASLAAPLANHETVDEHPPDDADYVTSDVPDAHDRYAFDDPALPNDAQIFAVAVDLRALKLAAGPQKVGPSLSSGGVVSDAGAFSLGDEPAYNQRVYNTDPDGDVPWTTAAVAALLAGPHLYLPVP